VCQELRTIHVFTTRPHGKQQDCFLFITEYMVTISQPFISFTNREKCMSCCSSVSDQGVEEEEDEPEPPQPFEWIED